MNPPRELLEREPEPLEKGLRRNVLGSVAGWSIPVVVNLVSIPILLRHLGASYYGILTLVTIASVYLGFLAGPTASGSVRFMATAYAAGDWPRFRESVHAGLLAAGSVSLLGSGLMFTAAPWLATRFFTVPQAEIPLTITALRYGAVLLLFTSLWNSVAAIPSAVRRVDVSSLMIAGATCAVNISGVVAALCGAGVVRIVQTQAVFSAASGIAGAVVCHWFLPRGALLPFTGVSGEQFRSQFIFGGQLSAGQLLSLLHLQIDRVIVAMKLGPAAVAAYGVPARVGDQISALLGRITAPLYPLAAEAHASGMLESYRRLYAQAVVNSLWVAGLIASVLIGSSAQLLQIWGVGKALPPESATILSLLAAANIARAPGVVAYQCGNGFGRGRLYIAQAGLGVILVGAPIGLLITRMGVTGAAAGFLIGIILLSTFYDLYTRRYVLGIRNPFPALAGYASIILITTAGSCAPMLPILPVHQAFLAVLRGAALTLLGYGSMTAVIGSINPALAPLGVIRSTFSEARKFVFRKREPVVFAS